MNNIILKDCVYNHWYIIVNGCGVIENNSIIQFIKKNEEHDCFLIAENYIDEKGLVISLEDSKKITVDEIFF